MSDTNKTINLSAIGPDAPGLMATITGKILELNGNIIDVEENARRGLFSIFLVIDFSYPITGYEKKSLVSEFMAGRLTCFGV